MILARMSDFATKADQLEVALSAHAMLYFRRHDLTHDTEDAACTCAVSS